MCKSMCQVFGPVSVGFENLRNLVYVSQLYWHTARFRKKNISGFTHILLLRLLHGVKDWRVITHQPQTHGQFFGTQTRCYTHRSI